MDKQKITNNITMSNKNIDILKKHFSHCFTKYGDFDFEKFKTDLSENDINFYKESYGMDWLGKSYARLLASDPATTLLKEDEEFNQKEENKNSENLLIKGDNLEVLKHLSNAYNERIKMIYIDPPYNTGSDGFVYQDNRKFTVSELKQLAGIDEDKAKRILDFTQSKSNSHSAWLTFMYPRLYIAKQLLKDDGVIFVSIDDNEVAQLRLLMDEIFGEENYLNLIVLENDSRARPYGSVATTHEYILVYSKNSDFIYKELINDQKKFKYKDKGRGFDLYELRNRNIEFNINNRPNLYYSFWINPKNKDGNGLYEISLTRKDDWIEVYPQESQGIKTVWRWGKEKSKENLNTILFGKKASSDTGFQIVKKYTKNTYVLNTVWTDKEIKTDKGTLEIKSLFCNKRLFNFPKPVSLIKRLMSIGTEKEAIIMDFFAGSGTTGDAVMQLNAKDGGKRKYILVQLPETIDPKKNKAAYDFVKDELKVKNPTIFEITKERLIRAAKKIQKENKDLFTKENKHDFGFKIFETMPIWEDYNLEADEFSEDLKLFDESKLMEEDINALLITWKTYDDISLTQDLQKIDLGNYISYYTNGKLYLMDQGFKTENLKKLLEKIDSDKKFNPTIIIAFGYHFESKNLREIAENIKSYANKKNIDINFITRY